MRRRRVAVLLGFALALVVGPGVPSWGRVPDVPRSFDIGRGDGQLVRLTAPDGQVWAAWSFDAGAESDVALAVRLANGSWTDPVFLGAGSGLDETHPTLAADAHGTLYVAFGVRNGAWIGLAVLPAGTGTWSVPSRVTPMGECASRPSLRVIGDRLVLAYRTAAGTALLDFPLLEAGPATHGVQDGPDILPPTGNNSGGAPGGLPLLPKR